MNDSFSPAEEVTTGRPELGASADPLRESWETLRRRTGESPGLYLGLALILGFTLQVLPIRFLLWSVLRLALFLLKPALLAFGAWKLVEIVEQSQRS
jgi:hypothetical protein